MSSTMLVIGMYINILDVIKCMYYSIIVSYKLSCLKEGLPSLKQHVPLVCLEHLQIRLFGYLFYAALKRRHRRTSTIVIESVGKTRF